MNFDGIKSGIQEIVNIAQKVPTEFQERCFDVLLNALLEELSDERSKDDERDQEPGKRDALDDKPARDEEGDNAIPVTTALRVLMQRADITEKQLKKLLVVADGDVHWLKEPSGKVATGQAEWSLLVALRAAILNNATTVDPEAVRSICQEKGFYDRANFATNFKSDKVKAYFKGPMVAQGDAQALTTAGEKALAT